MNFSFQHPSALFSLLLCIPVLISVFFTIKKLRKRMDGFYKSTESSACPITQRKYAIPLRVISRTAAWIFLVLAYTGLSWGKVMVPVQKKGRAISLVFDISYSMTAKDAPGGITRLSAAADYAKMLLDHASGSSVSVVLAKGDGFTAVPLTEDYAAVDDLLENLSPLLMSAPGTSLGKGIDAALRSFPHSSSQAAAVWVFTDGDETDHNLEPALMNAVTYGIPVILIGFGSERETHVLAGDGKTMVKTALRSAKMQKAVNDVIKNMSIGDKIRFSGGKPLLYVDAGDAGSALKILQSVNYSAISENLNEGNRYVSYEISKEEHHTLFMVLAIVFFIFSFLFAELDIQGINNFFFKRKVGANTLLLIFLCFVPILFTACTDKVEDSKTILKSTWNWHQEKYHEATAGFLKVVDKNLTGNVKIRDYALLGLSSTYMMLDENAAAYLRLQQISIDAPADVLFSKYYNSGIIEFYAEHYEQAVTYFKNALMLRPSDINSKINLELSQGQLELKKNGKNSEQLTPASESQDNMSERNSAVFDRIRESNRKIWKNQELQENGTSALDY